MVSNKTDTHTLDSGDGFSHLELMKGEMDGCSVISNSNVNDSDHCLIEFIEEEQDSSDMNIDEQYQYDAYIETHAIVLRQAKYLESNETFYCLKCQIEYKCLDDFKFEHKRLYEKQILEKKKLTSESEIGYEEEKEKNIEEKSKYINEPETENFEVQYLDENFADDSMDCYSNANIKNDGDNLFYCNDCETFFDDIISAEQHQCPVGTYDKTVISSEVVAKKSLRCQECEKQFNNPKALAVHRRIHKAKKATTKRMASTDKATCSVCNTTFRSEKNLKLHMKIHTIRHIKTIEDAIPPSSKFQYKEQDKFFCEICKKHFDQNVLVIHQSMHKNEEDHICNICNRQFENLPSYEMHLKVHVQKPVLMRPIKPKRVNLPGQKIKFPCQYCGREFPRPHEKVRHERVHTGEKPYECEVCGKHFRVPYSLTLHLRTHTEVRPYQCPTCNKCFKSQSVYAHHLKTHLAERGYKCDKCSKAFRTSVQLCAHKNSHTKPFNCSECNRPFSSLYAVKVHMKTHSKSNKLHENLKHRCAVCGAVYARLFALRYHMKNHHDMEMYDLKFTQRTNTPSLNDRDAAELIATATSSDHCILNGNGSNPHLIQNSQYLNDNGIPTEEMIQNEDVIVDTYQAEVIVTDWLSK